MEIVSLSRRQIVFGCATGLTAGVAYAHFIEPGWLELSTRRVKLRGRSLERPLRVLHLSDLHASESISIPFLRSAFEMAAQVKPDVICLTGDYVTSGESYDQVGYQAALRWLSTVAPCFAVLGNHDGVWNPFFKEQAQNGAPMASSPPCSFDNCLPCHGALCASGQNTKIVSLLESGGIRLLHNRSEYLRVAGSSVRFVGVGDLWINQVDPITAFSDPRPAAATILLSHNPYAKELFLNEDWDLMLCGHTHGGQLIIPKYGSPYAPVKDKRYVAGLLPYEKGLIHITRGVGTVHGYRLNCRPEVSLLVVS